MLEGFVRHSYVHSLFFDRMFAGEPDMDRMFQLPPNVHVGGNDKSLPFREIIRRFEVPTFLFTF